MRKSHDHSVADRFKDPLNLEASRTPSKNEPSPAANLCDTSVNPLWMITGAGAAFLLLLFAVS
jgi:hypothetical protein